MVPGPEWPKWGRLTSYASEAASALEVHAGNAIDRALDVFFRFPDAEEQRALKARFHPLAYILPLLTRIDRVLGRDQRRGQPRELERVTVSETTSNRAAPDEIARITGSFLGAAAGGAS